MTRKKDMSLGSTDGLVNVAQECIAVGSTLVRQARLDIDSAYSSRSITTAGTALIGCILKVLGEVIIYSTQERS